MMDRHHGHLTDTDATRVSHYFHAALNTTDTSDTYLCKIGNVDEGEGAAACMGAGEIYRQRCPLGVRCLYLCPSLAAPHGSLTARYRAFPEMGPSPASGLRGARSPGLCPATRNIEIPKFGFPLVIRFTHDRRT